MAGLKEIKRRLRSVRNTKKITYAMKLVSAAKLKKAQESATSSRAYTKALGELLTLLRSDEKLQKLSHPLLANREAIKRVRVVVIGGNRGLCGGYNSNLNRKVEEVTRSIRAELPTAEIDYVLIGRKPAQFFRRIRRPYLHAYEELSENVPQWPLPEIAQELEHDFATGVIDRAVLVFTRFRSALSVIPSVEMLLPLDLSAAQENLGQSEGDEVVEKVSAAGILFEPSPEAVFEGVIPRIMRTKLLQAAFESKASEQGSRMTAMDSATKNAGELIDKLQLKHNKLRQSGVTSDLLDIVGGAEALNAQS